jgi:hypothetical protein
MPIKHTFSNPIADDPAFLGTKPSDWNADHTSTGDLDLGTGNLITSGSVNGLTGAQITDLTDGGATTLHTHAAQIVPATIAAVSGSYLTAYSATTGSFSSGSVTHPAETDPVFLARATNTGHYSGFPTRVTVTDPTSLVWDDGTYTLTLGGTNFKIYISGVEYNIASALTKQVTDATALYWFWIELVTGVPTLQMQSSNPGFDKCLVAAVYWNTAINKGMMSDERHWMGRDKMNHEMLHQTIGARWYKGGTISYPAANTFSITECNLYDEDLLHVIPLSTTCKILYKNGSADWQWDTGATYLAKINGSTIRWNNGNALADLGNSQFMAMWVFATNNLTEPFISIMGQYSSSTIARARTDNTPDTLSLGALPSAEMKLLYRVIFKQGTTAPIETADYRNVSNLPVANYTATDHSTLANLTFATASHTGFQEELTATAPLAIASGSVISIAAATSGSAGSMSAADKTKIDFLYISSSGSLAGDNTGDQVVPVTTGSVSGSFINGYDATTGSFTSAAAGGSSGGKVLLFDSTLSGDGVIDTDPTDLSGYDDLEILCETRGTRTDMTDYIEMYFNNDTTNTNYHSQFMYHVNGGTHASDEYALPEVGSTTANDSPANSFGYTRVYIPDYAGGHIKICDYGAGAYQATDNVRVTTGTMVYKSTSAITRIMIHGEVATNLLTGSRMRVFGIKY